MHRGHVAADAAEAEAADDALLDHVLLKVRGHREARAADSHLEGEARPHYARRFHEEEGVLRYAEVDGVARDARRARSYLRGVADAVRDDHLVDEILRNGDFRRKRILDEVVRNRYDVRRAARVRYRVAERAAGRRPLHAVDVAEAVAGRSREEGHVYLNRALFYRARASAVAADDYRNVGLAARKQLPELAAHTGGVELADEAALYIIRDAVVSVGNRARREGQILEAHRLEFGEHHRNDRVAVAQMVVERYRHAVAQAGLFYRVAQRFRALVAARDGGAHRLRRGAHSRGRRYSAEWRGIWLEGPRARNFKRHYPAERIYSRLHLRAPPFRFRRAPRAPAGAPNARQSARRPSCRRPRLRPCPRVPRPRRPRRRAEPCAAPPSRA